jgi:hypothetical protein
MKLSTKLGAVARALRLTGLGIAGFSLLSSNVYIAGGGMLLIAAGEGLQGASDYLDSRGNGS